MQAGFFFFVSGMIGHLFGRVNDSQLHRPLTIAAASAALIGA